VLVRRLVPVAVAAAAGIALAVLAKPSAERERGELWTTPVRFALAAPAARGVALVGDFNDWDRDATPLEPVGAGDEWAVTVRLRPGRHAYAFVEPFTMLRDSAGGGPDSVRLPEPSSGRLVRSRHYTDAELGAEWRSGRLTLQLVGGARLGDAASVAETWGSAYAAYTLREGVALTAAAGVMPARFERGLGRAPFGRIGLRFGLSAGTDRAHAVPAAPAPSLVARDVGGGYAVLRAHVPGAQRVEIKGDFTDWKPVDLAAAGAGTWEARLRVAPGVYRVNLRVDGGPWIAPPGLPSVVDEFGSAVGILVVD